MSERINVGDLEIDKSLYTLVKEQIAPDTGVELLSFWQGFEKLLKQFSPENKALLSKRDDLQIQIDNWHRQRSTLPHNPEEYESFLRGIGYLLEEGEDFQITTENVDDEIAKLAGPQLVVPITNARFSLNAANARWGSLYDSLYGTDVIPESEGCEKAGDYNPARGAKVIAYAASFLNEHFPLLNFQYQDIIQYSVRNGELVLQVEGGQEAKLINGQGFVGYLGDEDNPCGILLKHNGLHVEIQIDRQSQIGKSDRAGVKDLLMESALSTIQDCEDSVAAVDAADKVLVYSNWLGLMKGTLAEEFDKGGSVIRRELNKDRVYKDAAYGENGRDLTLHGRSLLLVRNVGHLMTSDAILLKGDEIPEGIMDGVITSFCALHDLKSKGPIRNSRKASIYIVKPKMHGPEEVAFTNTLFGKVEETLGLKKYSIK